MVKQLSLDEQLVKSRYVDRAMVCWKCAAPKQPGSSTCRRCRGRAVRRGKTYWPNVSQAMEANQLTGRGQVSYRIKTSPEIWAWVEDYEYRKYLEEEADGQSD